MKMKKSSFKKQETLSEDPSSVPLNVINVNVNNNQQMNSPEEKKAKKSCMDKLKGVSVVLKITVALLTISTIVGPIIVSKTKAFSVAPQGSGKNRTQLIVSCNLIFKPFVLRRRRK